MREEVERFGGTVAQLTGDGVLALFGAPDGARGRLGAGGAGGARAPRVARRYAAEVAPALRDRDRAHAWRSTPARWSFPAATRPGSPLQRARRHGERGGSAAGVRRPRGGAGDGAPGRRDLRAGGARRAGTEGKERARQRVPRHWRPRRAVVRASRAPLVGREQELAALNEALDGLLEGKGAIVSITGEPGIGKSRLVAEAQERFAGRVRFLAGHAVSYAETIPYWPVREQLRSWLGLGVSDPEARVRLELRTELARTLDDDGRRGLSLPRQPPRPSAQPGAGAADPRSRTRRGPTRDVLLALPARLHARRRTTAVPDTRGSPLVGRGDALAARRAAPRGRADRGRLPARPSQ